jgi:hypothetical protein
MLIGFVVILIVGLIGYFAAASTILKEENIKARHEAKEEERR